MYVKATGASSSQRLAEGGHRRCLGKGTTRAAMNAVMKDKNHAGVRLLRDIVHVPCPGGCHDLTEGCVLDILSEVGAGPEDVLLDIGYGTGTAMMVAAAAVGMDAVGIELDNDIHGTMRNFLLTHDGVEKEDGACGPAAKRARFQTRHKTDDVDPHRFDAYTANGSRIFHD